MQKFDDHGHFLLAWGGSGSGDGDFSGPAGIAIDASGKVYVSDQNNARVEVFTPDGGYLDQFGSGGDGNGELDLPLGIACDAAGNLYVADYQNDRVQRFAANGTYLGQWGATGSQNGAFSGPVDVAIDAAGDVYVADHGNARIQKFTALGGFVRAFGGPGSGDGQLNGPLGVAVDRVGDVFVAEYNNDRVQKFDQDGGFLGRWGTFGSGDGQFLSPVSVDVDGAGGIYVLEYNGCRVQKFGCASTSGCPAVFELAWGGPGGAAALDRPWGRDRHGGNVYVADTFHQRVQKFTAAGAPISSWGTPGPGNGQFLAPVGIAVDRAGVVFVTDRVTHRVQAFSGNGTFVRAWGGPGAAAGQFQTPCGIAVDAGGTVFVADSGNARIQTFTGATGAYRGQWGSGGAASGQFAGPQGVAVDGMGAVYVVDRGNARVQKFDSTGTFLAQWGSPGTGAGQLSSPTGIAADAAGNVWVADGANRVQRFSCDGGLRSQCGTGSEGALSAARGVAVDRAGRLLVVDPAANRIARFADAMSYTITAAAGAHGAISPASTSCAPLGHDLAFRFLPDPGYVVAGVLVDGFSVGADTGYTFRDVRADHAIAVSFTVVTYTLTASAGSGGTISPAGVIVVSHGATQKLTVAPASCHHIADVRVDGVSVGPLASVTLTSITAPHTVTASFAPDTFTVAATASAGGAVTPAGATSVACGDDFVVDLVAEPCHHLAGLVVDGVAVAPVTTYRFAAVAAPHTLQASFAPDTLSITLDARPRWIDHAGGTRPGGVRRRPHVRRHAGRLPSRRRRRGRRHVDRGARQRHAARHSRRSPRHRRASSATPSS